MQSWNTSRNKYTSNTHQWKMLLYNWKSLEAKTESRNVSLTHSLKVLNRCLVEHLHFQAEPKRADGTTEGLWVVLDACTIVDGTGPAKAPKAVLASKHLVGLLFACQQGHYKQPSVAHLWDSRTSVEPTAKSDQCEPVSSFLKHLDETCR